MHIRTYVRTHICLLTIYLQLLYYIHMWPGLQKPTMYAQKLKFVFLAQLIAVLNIEYAYTYIRTHTHLFTYYLLTTFVLHTYVTRFAKTDHVRTKIEIRFFGPANSCTQYRICIYVHTYAHTFVYLLFTYNFCTTYICDQVCKNRPCTHKNWNSVFWPS